MKLLTDLKNIYNKIETDPNYFCEPFRVILKSIYPDLDCKLIYKNSILLKKIQQEYKQGAEIDLELALTALLPFLVFMSDNKIYITEQDLEILSRNLRL